MALGARLVEFAGYEMPIQYDGILAEHARVREAVGLFDVSHMGEVSVRGPEAIAAVNRLITNDLRRIDDGRAQYAALCADDGTIIDDLIVYRLAPDHLFICVNASNRAADVAHMAAHLTGDATLEDESDAWSQIAVQGPRAPTLLGRVLGDDVAALKTFRVVRRDFRGAACVVATTGYTGERGAEIYVPNAQAGALWGALMEAGEDLGVGPVGLGARDTLRLEMGYCLYGNDIDRSTTPLEAGLGWVTRLDKPGGFIGRDALAAQAARGPTRQLVALELDERGIPRHGCPVLAGGEVVGHVTSGNQSPTTGRAIALAYVPIGLTAPGTALTVDIRGKLKAAHVTTLPFYQPAKA